MSRRRTLTGRLESLEKTFAPVLQTEDPWGDRARYRDEILELAKQRGDYEETKKWLEEIGPVGLWMQIARHHLRAHGFEQLPTEGFIHTMGRALGYNIEEMRLCIEEGRLGKELVSRFAGTRIGPHEGMNQAPRR